MQALQDCIFRNLYGKLYLHQYLEINNIFHRRALTWQNW